MRYGEGTDAAFRAAAAARSLEWVARQREIDADHRHDRRVRAFAEALRTAVASNGEVFAADCDVASLAVAAVAVYERQHGR